MDCDGLSAATSAATLSIAVAAAPLLFSSPLALEWSLEPEPEQSRSRILHFYVGAGAEPKWQL